MKGPLDIKAENRRAEEGAFMKWIASKGHEWEKIVRALVRSDAELDSALYNFIPYGQASGANESLTQTRHALELLKMQWRAEAEAKRNGR